MAHASVPENEIIHGPTGSVARLVDRLLQQDPQAQVRFCTGPLTQYQLASVYSDDTGTVWIDLEE